MSGDRREFIAWRLKACVEDGIKPAAVMDADAIELLAERLRTALQTGMHLTSAFEHAFRLGEKWVSVESSSRYFAGHRRNRAGTPPQRL